VVLVPRNRVHAAQKRASLVLGPISQSWVELPQASMLIVVVVITSIGPVSSWPEKLARVVTVVP